MSNRYNLQGKVALVTGAGSARSTEEFGRIEGVGSGIARILAENGCDILFTYNTSVEGARDLQKEHRAGSAEAVACLKKHLPRYAAMSDSEASENKLGLREAQQVLARENGFSSWQKLKAHVESPSHGTEELLRWGEEQPEEAARVLRARRARGSGSGGSRSMAGADVRALARHCGGGS